MSISAFGDKVPQFGPGVFVHVDATVIGDVVLEEGVTVWPGAVLRGDVERIVVGAYTSFQDGAVAHSDPGSPVRIGRRVHHRPRRHRPRRDHRLPAA